MLRARLMVVYNHSIAPFRYPLAAFGSRLLSLIQRLRTCKAGDRRQSTGPFSISLHGPAACASGTQIVIVLLDNEVLR